MIENKKEELIENINLISKTINDVSYTKMNKGIYSILWGSTTILASSVDILRFIYYPESFFNLNKGLGGFYFYILSAIITIIIYISDKVKNIQKGYSKSNIEYAIESIWIPYVVVISLFPLFINFFEYIDYYNFKSINTITEYKFNYSNKYSLFSLLILFYTFPTFAIGRIRNNKLILSFSIISFILFLITFYTGIILDFLFIGISGLINWLIPGIIIRKKYLKTKKQKIINN